MAFTEMLWTELTQEWADNETELVSFVTTMSSQDGSFDTSVLDAGYDAEVTTEPPSGNLTGNDVFKFTFRNCVFIILASLMSLITVFANVLLIILVFIDPKLRRLSNYYIVSLACADLIVGIFVVPMFSLYTILGSWPLGEFVCELWISADFTCVSASIFGICMISLDRYWAITQPLKHRRRQRKERALAFVAAIWIVSGLCWIPAVVAHRIILGSFATEFDCIYLPRFTYVLISTVIIYVIPMISLVFLYVRILAAVKNNLLQLQLGETEKTEISEPDYKRTMCCCHRSIKKDSTLPDNKGSSISTISLAVNLGPTLSDDLKDSGTNEQIAYDNPLKVSNSTNGNTLTIPPVTAQKDVSHLKRRNVPEEGSMTTLNIGNADKKNYSNQLRAERNRQQQLSRHRLHERTARTLGIVVFVFLICWVPFVILFPVNSYCSCVPPPLYDTSYWLAYLNSTMNPFLYGFNKDFRRALRKFICPRRKSQENVSHSDMG